MCKSGTRAKATRTRCPFVWFALIREKCGLTAESGTRNNKAEYDKPRPVRLVICGPKRIYSLDQFPTEPDFQPRAERRATMERNTSDGSSPEDGADRVERARSYAHRLSHLSMGKALVKETQRAN
jgi:hypothetical protein